MSKGILLVLFTLISGLVLFNYSQEKLNLQSYTDNPLTWGEFQMCEQQYDCLTIDCTEDPECMTSLQQWAQCNKDSHGCPAWWMDYFSSHSSQEQFPAQEMKSCLIECPTQNQQIQTAKQCLMSCGKIQ